ncbi:MAG: DUF4143 domain-containing protein [Erysipelotrichia bacterium]|nr:DUF4143 domain-containing protein [Erysipelotrichia bacterium]
MERKIEKRLLDWKQQKKRKPLLIKGARQVGKTYSIRKFAKNHYHDVAEINFERDSNYVSLFERSRKPEDFLNELKINFINIPFDEHTLLFLDEIQACPNAITALKFMAEEFAFDIICSGSMLGVAIANTSSFPVGYVETWEMYPMSFLEFLSAYRLPHEIMEMIKQPLDKLESIPFTLHERMNELFTTYMMIGGMPEVVAKYIESKSFKECLLIQRRIVNDYLNDMAKYAYASDKIKARECFSSIFMQLAKENKKFQYGVVKKGYNARYYDTSLRWLADSGTILKVNRLSQIANPLSSNVELSVFKIYMSDVGLFISQLSDGDVLKIINGDLGIYKGVLYENIVAQTFKRAEKKCYYYEPSQFSEIDFIIEYEGNITPIEVKAGKHTTSKAFNNFVNKHNPSFAFRFSAKNVDISKNNNIKYLPLYLLENVLENEKEIIF